MLSFPCKKYQIVIFTIVKEQEVSAKYRRRAKRARTWTQIRHSRTVIEDSDNQVLKRK
ncbi:hypothetical protein HMPREF9151_01370 [Hoylesella saccharolytica F0055]|uniref:Uncharacterized protein n=1 Tax=Hoylesella saccharolytica F0055 TaxID=1127699 RepID=L1NA30_9BACT|nr:hypothetical protein HMPREF9151_01370 [Hoylesella saccharolytica F0055]